MSKRLDFSDNARSKLKSGVDKLANAVKVTLGPGGRNVIIDKGFGSPTVTKDGVTVARGIELPDLVENVGAQLVKEVSSKTNDAAGDGTTTATVLAQAIYTDGLKRLSSGVNSTALRRGIEKSAALVVGHLKSIAKPVDGDGIKRVATISANSEELGTTIAEAMEKVGKDGIITVEESPNLETVSEVVDGMRIDRGFMSPYMISDPQKMEAELTDTPVFITDYKLSSQQELVPLLEALAKTGVKQLVIVAEEVDGDALAMLVVNKMRGVFQSLAVKAPGFGDQKKEQLKDLAALTGATFVSEELGMTLDQVTAEHLGRAHRVVGTKDHTTFVGGAGTKDAIETRVNEIRTELEKAEGKFDKERLAQRLAKLSGGIGVIKVGGATETELQEVKQRVEDALQATKAAAEEGIVPGGGTALLMASFALRNSKDKFYGDEQVGKEIVLNALEVPIKTIAENAGENGEVVLDKVLHRDDPGSAVNGFDAAKHEYVVMEDAGIIDPVKVVRSALQNAASIAALLLTTETVVTAIPEESKEEPPRFDV